MKILHLVLFITVCSLLANVSYGQNCPPNSVYPNPQIVSSFSPDSSCINANGHSAGGGPDNRDCLLACEHSFTTYCTMSVAGSTYSWSVVGGTIVGSSTSNCVTVLWGPTGNGTISVTETNTAGCTATKEQCVKIIDSPVAAFSVPATVCKNVPLSFINLSQNAIGYFWNFGDGGTSTVDNPTHAYSIPGPHTVTLVAYNKCGCVDSATFVVNVSNLDGPIIACPATVCANTQACYSTPSGCPTAVYHWVVNGGTIVGASNLDHICVFWGAGPQGTVSLFITGCGNVCTDTTKVTVPIISSNGPITGNAVVCPGSNEVYTLPLWPGTYYNWTLSGGGMITSGMNTNHISVQWGLAPGTYILTATWNNILLGCGGTATFVVDVRNTFQMFGQTGPFCIGSTSFFSANGNANWTVTGGTFTGNGTSSIAVTWTTGGPQTVTAVPLNPNLYCNPSVSMAVTVASVPPATAITGPATICVGGSYQYTATPSGPGYTFQWSVTGGTIVGSATANPVTVQWTGAGTVSVQQVQTSPPFCSSAPISLPVTVLSIPNISGSGSACMDQTSSFSAGAPNPSLVYTWSIVDGFGNPSPLGSITTGQGTNAITVLWHGPGGNVFVKVSVCSNTLTLPVTVNPKPTPTISMTGHACNPGGTVILTASAGSSYLWSNGANTQTIVVSSSGPYWVRVTNAAGCSDTARIVVPATQGPVASISTPNPTHYCIPTPPFVDTLYALQGPGYTYQWFPGLQVTPTITVNATGSYYVVVTDANGCSSTSNTITITADTCQVGGGCTPVGTIAFTFPTPACNPVSFSGTTTGGVTNTSWNFGDPASGANNTSTLTNPTHTFTQAGWFTVTYSGVDPNSCPVSVSHPVAIPLAADFSFNVHCDSVFFTDNSTFLPPNSITSWSWSFPGGSPSTSNVQNPAVTYSSPGSHSVTLTVTNALCTVSITKTVIVAPPPSAAFTLPASTCAGTDIALSGSTAASWSWNFGDAATSGLQNTSHAWTIPGTYTVTLTVTDASGCTDVVSHSITINAPSTFCPITPSNPAPICQGDSVVLTASPGVSYQWQFNAVNILIGGNGPTYTALQTGSYTVIVTDAGGCKCTSPPVVLMVNPLPPATITPDVTPVICGSGFINLTAPPGSYSYLWSTGDTTQSIFLSLNIPGAYTYTVTVTDSNPPGCSATSAPFTVNVYGLPPTPIITASGPTALCKGDSVTLTSSVPTNNHWSTGATTQSITVHQAGVYTVTVISNHGCSSSASITVTSGTPDLSLYPFGCDLLCDTVKIPGPIGPYIGYYTYQWYFNGNPIPPANGINDTLTPIGSGTYTLVLTGPGPTFCKDTTGPYNLSLKDCDSLHCKGRICGRKWNDSNGNHKLNYGTEFGVPNWKICLVKCNVDNYPTHDTVACTTTDSSGFYCFDNLCAGDYCVVEVNRPGWQQTWPISPPFYHVTITDSQTVNGIDFGNRKKCIEIWTTVDTVGIPPNALVLPQPHSLPPFAQWPVRIMYQEQPTPPSVPIFEGMITNNVMPIPFCKHGYYWIVRGHVANHKFDRIYVNDSLRSDNGDSVLVAINDSTDGATVLMLNVYDPDPTVRFRTFTAAQLAGAEQAKPVKRPRPGKPIPMPNTANVIDELLRQGGTLIAGLQGQINASKHTRGYLYPANQADVFKTFATRGVPHTAAPHGLDRDLMDKLILKRQKSVPATKHNNRFLANLLALKINILASDRGKTPPGFGDLIYTPPEPVMWFVEGQEYSVRAIARIADSMLTNWEGISYQKYDDINAVIESLNVAFAGPLPFGTNDTASWVNGGKLSLTGARALADVPFLLKVSGMAGVSHPTLIGGAALPEVYSLADCYPNPFNPLTTIRYSLPENSRVTVRVYDVLGREMTTLVNQIQEAGTKAVVWNANGFASGVYFYRLEAVSIGDPSNSFTQVKKMLLLK